MKKSEIRVGGFYLAKVNNNIVTVRVDSIDVRPGYGSSKDGTTYGVTNMKTGRTTSFRSAAKFREEVPMCDKCSKPFTRFRGDKPNTCLTCLEGSSRSTESYLNDKGDENRSDPTLSAMPAAEQENGTNQQLSPATPVKVVDGLASKLRRTNLDSSPHLIIEARAGTGKTTTLIEGLKRLKGVPSNHPAALNPSPQQEAVYKALEMSKGKANTVCFVAFNKSIATELQSRVPSGCDAMTMHSMGYKAVRAAFGNPKVNQYRMDEILSEYLGMEVREMWKEKHVIVKAVKELVGLCKMNLLNGTPDDLAHLTSYYEVETNGSQMEIFDLVPKVLDRCKDVRKDNAIDFNDMIWIPVALGLPVMKYDALLVDEAQDLNRCQQALAKMAGRRLVLCGDPKQAIYGFAGADAESMNRMGEELRETEKGCLTLPLTVTRRCSKAVVKEANKIVIDFSAHETNGEGKVSRAGFEKDTPEEYRKIAGDGDFILCRVNAPLVSECFRFIKAGRPANINGRDVGQGLISTISKLMKGEDERADGSIVTLTQKLSDWLATEMKKENAKRFPSEARIIALEDKHDCIMYFTEGVKNVVEVKDRIEQIFVDRKAGENKGILLSSIHKAKGLEAKRVFLLEPNGATCPHPMASSEWQIEQEWNLRYVAITRAIEELVYVS